MKNSTPLPEYSEIIFPKGCKFSQNFIQLSLTLTKLYHINCNHTHTFNGPFSGIPGWAGTRKVSQSGFYWSKRQWAAVASAGPHASLHLAPDRQPHQHPTTQFFTGRMPFLLPNQQRQRTEGKVQPVSEFLLLTHRRDNCDISAGAVEWPMAQTTFMNPDHSICQWMQVWIHCESETGFSQSEYGASVCMMWCRSVVWTASHRLCTASLLTTSPTALSQWKMTDAVFSADSLRSLCVCLLHCYQLALLCSASSMFYTDAISMNCLCATHSCRSKVK